jgi:DNA-binding CsgD family transcriptional regulator
MLLYALAIRSRLHHRMGRWAASRADADEAVELQRGVAQDTIFTTYVLAVAAITKMDAGDLGEGQRLATGSLAAARRSGSQTLLLWTHWARGRLALLEGRSREAVEALQEGERLAARIQWGAPAAAETRGDLGDALAIEGDADAIRALAAGLRQDAEPTVRLPLAVAARLEGIAAGDEDFEPHFAEALEHHDALAMPYERARTLLALGTRRRRARRVAEAREPLQEALDVFDRLGADPWAARAREELRLAGTRGSTATAAAEPEQALTGQEWRIAELVVQGMTNREVGAALFLSPKTIEHHLSAIYRKLGVRSRTQLARLFGDEVASTAA